VPYLSASSVVIHYEEALYQVYARLPFTKEVMLSSALVSHFCSFVCVCLFAGFSQHPANVEKWDVVGHINDNKKLVFCWCITCQFFRASSSEPVLPLFRDFHKKSMCCHVCEVELKEFVMTLVQLPVSMLLSKV